MTREIVMSFRLDAGSYEDARDGIAALVVAVRGSQVRVIPNPHPRRTDSGRRNSSGIFWHGQIVATAKEDSR